MIYEFTLHVKPMPYKRVRGSFRGGKAVFHNEPKYKAFKQTLTGYAQQKISKPFAQHVPLTIALEFGMGPRAKSNKHPQFTKTPDVDNLAKAVMDSLNKIAYHDDCQIIELYTKKYYSEKPFIKVVLSTWEE